MPRPAYTTIASLLTREGYPKEASILIAMHWRDQQQVLAAAEGYLIYSDAYAARQLAREVRDVQGAVDARLYSEGEV